MGNLEFCLAQEPIEQYFSSDKTEFQDNKMNLQRIHTVGLQRQMLEIKQFVEKKNY